MPRSTKLDLLEKADEILGDELEDASRELLHKTMDEEKAEERQDGKEEAPLSLLARLAIIKGSLPTIEPQGENRHFQYRFIKNTQVLGALRPRLAKHGIMIVPEIVEELEPIPMRTAKGGSSLLTRIRVTWRVVCETGESFTGQSLGYGDDSGDKGANKAFTAAQKNFLLRLFEIGGEPDIEEDEETDRRAKIRESGVPPVESVEIEAATVKGIKRGGHATTATEPQLKAISRAVRDLHLTPEAFSNLIDTVLGDALDEQEVSWASIKDYLSHLSAADLGKLIAHLETLSQGNEAGPEDL